MPKRRKKGRPKVEPLLGSKAFGHDPEGRPTGAKAVGNPDPETPLRGALLFGNDPDGAPRGSAAVGKPDKDAPLRGALLFGNDPEGAPRGSAAIGKPDKETPLRGALLFGNDPKGLPRGALTFGNPDEQAKFRGSQAFGSTERIPDKLHKDPIGYDFGGVLLRADEGSMAGIRKDPRDAIRLRVLKSLERLLDMDRERLRQGLGESAIKWGKLRREPGLWDRQLAEELRTRFRKAPGEILGIGHVRDLLEETERLHTFSLRGEWDRMPHRLTVFWDEEEIGYAETVLHNQHEYFVVRDMDRELLGYADAIKPYQKDQVARVRAPDGSIVGTLEITRPGIPAALKGEEPEEEVVDKVQPLVAPDPDPGGPVRFQGTMRDANGKPHFRLEEKRARPDFFKAELLHPISDEVIGRIEDRMRQGKVRTIVEVDATLPCVLVWAMASIVADLARLRRRGWPEAPEPPEEEVESVEEALGPSRSRS